MLSDAATNKVGKGITGKAENERHQQPGTMEIQCVHPNKGRKGITDGIKLAIEWYKENL